MKENVSGHSVTQETTVILGLLWTMAKHMPLKGLRSSTGMTAVKRTKNFEVRVSEELPTSASQKYFGGSLLGNFAGPGTNGQHIIISGGDP